MKLKVSLFKKGDIDRAIKEIEKYRRSLVDKSEIFVRRLAEMGVKAASEAIATGQGDSSRDARFSISYTIDGEIVEGVLSITSDPHVLSDGRTYYPHLGWEFGAGIHYNNGNINPKAHELGMGVGTFPDQRYAFNEHWWYRDEDKKLHISQGTEATMPMYKASIEIMEAIETVAREVYGNG